MYLNRHGTKRAAHRNINNKTTIAPIPERSSSGPFIGSLLFTHFLHPEGKRKRSSTVSQFPKKS
uniref:Uncharacterized protein n=1 Tax=Anopheles dirus TaxID=7168 RepID=A0A182NXF9_9DIPT